MRVRHDMFRFLNFIYFGCAGSPLLGMGFLEVQ